TFDHRLDHQRYELCPMLAVSIENYENISPAVSGVVETGSDSRSIALVRMVPDHMSPCESGRVGGIVRRSVVNDEDLPRELTRFKDDRADRWSFVVRGNCSDNPRFH